MGKDIERLSPIDDQLLRDVDVEIEARLGDTRMTVADLMALKADSVVVLDRSLADHVELYLKGVAIARGEIVAVGDKLGVRVLELAPDA